MQLSASFIQVKIQAERSMFKPTEQKLNVGFYFLVMVL